MKDKIVEIYKNKIKANSFEFEDSDGVTHVPWVDLGFVLEQLDLFFEEKTRLHSAGEEVSDCTTCKYFISFRDDYFGDEYEPEEYGRCKNSMSHLYGYKGAGEGLKCEHYNSKLTRPTVSEGEIDILYEEHCSDDGYTLSRGQFKAAIKELLNR